MSNTESLAPHLPYLRRYARALTGSQTSGDRYVRAALNAILTGEQTLAPSSPPRVALYQLFHATWLSASGQVENDIFNVNEVRPSTVDERLALLDAEQRAVLILTAVEGFRADEAAVIVGGTAADVEFALVEAQKSVDSQTRARVLIIEDEPIIAMDLHNLVADLGHEVVGIAATRDQAVETALEKRPSLVLADVNLGQGGSGIDAVKQILDSFDIPIVFVTAYPEKLLTGDRPEPAYLVAKPFLPECIRTTISQALFFHQPSRIAA
jgi:CheY-like chemotaxis protein